MVFFSQSSFLSSSIKLKTYMLKYALSKYTSPAFHLFNLITSKLSFVISLMGCAGLCYISTLSWRLAGKDPTHGQQERQRMLSFCPVWLSLLVVWNLLGVCQTCKASKQAQRNGTVKLNLRKIIKLFGKRNVCWMGVGQTLLFPTAGTHSTDMLVCHHLGHLASPVLNLKHLFSPGVFSLQLLFQR